MVGGIPLIVKKNAIYETFYSPILMVKDNEQCTVSLKSDYQLSLNT